MRDMSERYNKQGRAYSDSMKLREFKKYLSTLKPEAEFESLDYLGFEISGREQRWYVKNDPRIFTSKRKAIEAIDYCLALRKELEAHS